jgi:uncharacterized iron-regulated membrane protein
MAWLHTWSGLLVGWVLFAVFLTGTAAYLRPELTRWMRPELMATRPDPVQAALTAVARLRELAPQSANWFIEIAGPREPVTTVFWRAPPKAPGTAPGGRGFRQATLDPVSGATLDARDTRGGNFFYRFHFELYAMPVLWGRWIVTICGMFMLVAILSGIITHRRIFADFFTFRPNKGQRSWLDGHAVAAVLALPYHLMITYTGLTTLMVMTLPWGITAAYGPAGPPAFFADTAPFAPKRPAGQPAALADVAPMLAEAVQAWGGAPPGRITVNHPGDANASVVILSGPGAQVAEERTGMAFDGVTGARLAAWGTAGSAAAQTRGVMTGLHIGLFAGPMLRGLLLLSGLAGTVMVGTGCVLWSVKARQKAEKAGRKGFGLRLVDVLNVAGIAGLPLAMATFLWANRLLPLHLAGRADWEVKVFFGAWLLAVVHAALRPRPAAWTEQWGVAALLYALLPVLNALTTGRHLGRSLPDGDWGMAGMDLGFLAIGLGLGAVTLARRGWRFRLRPRAQGRAGALRA